MRAAHPLSYEARPGALCPCQLLPAGVSSLRRTLSPHSPHSSRSNKCRAKNLQSPVFDDRILRLRSFPVAFDQTLKRPWTRVSMRVRWWPIKSWEFHDLESFIVEQVSSRYRNIICKYLVCFIQFLFYQKICDYFFIRSHSTKFL